MKKMHHLFLGCGEKRGTNIYLYPRKKNDYQEEEESGYLGLANN